jgi:hypothetical protein
MKQLIAELQEFIKATKAYLPDAGCSEADALLYKLSSLDPKAAELKDILNSLNALRMLTPEGQRYLEQL